MLDPVTGWFEIKSYNDKCAITIKNLAKTTCLARYPFPIEITYEQVKRFIGHEFIKFLTEK